MRDSSLKELWTDGESLEVGRVVMKRLTAEQRAAKARDVMDVCVRGRDDLPSVVRRVVEIGEVEADWPKAHKAFQAVRALALRTPESSPDDLLLLFTEYVAKTIYNGSRGAAPFDEDCSWYVAPLAQRLARAYGDADLETEIFTMLTWGVPRLTTFEI